MNQTPAFTSAHGRWITPIFVLLAFYVLGASMMDGFAIYHTWRFVGEADFIKMHIESGGRIVPLFVLPALIMTIFQILLFWHRPTMMSRISVGVGLSCTVICWASSALIQIPIQMQLDQGKNEQLLNQLIVTDWIRQIPTVILAMIVLNMLFKIFRSLDTVNK